MIDYPKIVEDRVVPHRGDSQGIRVGRVQVVEYRGKREEHWFWYQNGALHHISTRDL